MANLPHFPYETPFGYLHQLLQQLTLSSDILSTNSKNLPFASSRQYATTLWVYAMRLLMNVWEPPSTGSSKIWSILLEPTTYLYISQEQSHWSLCNATEKTPFYLWILMVMTQGELDGFMNLSYIPHYLQKRERGQTRYLLNPRLTTTTYLCNTRNSTSFGDSRDVKQEEKNTTFFLF